MMKDSRIFGYVRVSTILQKEDRQLIAMEEFGVPDDIPPQRMKTPPIKRFTRKSSFFPVLIVHIANGYRMEPTLLRLS